MLKPRLYKIAKQTIDKRTTIHHIVRKQDHTNNECAQFQYSSALISKFVLRLFLPNSRFSRIICGFLISWLHTLTLAFPKQGTEESSLFS